ncbi:helix-turn-helix domain-containing protein [Bacillaceae bacterium C204]|uniref:helix-turn-helix domain-containing protein n=1 Tax=Neobacillus sp. 204 TaxID=3383351 RepID=UPI0039787B88
MGKKVKMMIFELIDERNISMRELSRLTSVRPAALNQLANQKRKNINFGHIEKIAEALNLDDISKIITLIDTDEERDD